MVKQKMIWIKTPEESLKEQFEAKIELREKKIIEILGTPEEQEQKRKEHDAFIKKVEDLLKIKL